MKISGIVIQERNIEVRGQKEFIATYKGKRIYITTNHGFGKAKHDFLTRYMIDVTDIKTGLYDVEAYDDFHNMADAIRYALKGACLIP